MARFLLWPETMPLEPRVELGDDLTLLENSVRSNVASKARDKITHNLLHHGLADFDYGRSAAGLGVTRRSTSVAGDDEKDEKIKKKWSPKSRRNLAAGGRRGYGRRRQ
ncbi:hypothetical protein D1007_13161 [Hordeum vulgare]|nr:hypothetical protein D1007_13161 [Hordeum vulgare]